MIRLVVRGSRETITHEFAASLAASCAASLAAESTGTRILGPAPAPIAKLRGRYRFQLQLQGPDPEGLRAAVRRAQQELQPPEDVQWIADVDPLDML